MKLLKLLEAHPTRSAWEKGVKGYAIDLLEALNERGHSEDSRLNQYDHIELVVSELTLLNGASNWSEYSYGGCALIYDSDIAEALCTPSELKARKGGDWQPSKNETWLDVQARALGQACRLILKLNKKIK
jgi:hypothetical protein|tara:strand:- start:504 stop:893 length:390 start_codon:yes stop_codon:yes gene_type:complete